MNHNDFEKMSPEVKQIQDLDEKCLKLISESKYSEAAAVCEEIRKNLIDLNEVVKEGKKVFFEELENDVRDRHVLCYLKMEDYDTTLELGLKFLEEKENYGINSSLGICYFKKGKYYKARDHFKKAKEINPNIEDKIVENYFKQTLEMIADIEN